MIKVTLTKANTACLKLQHHITREENRQLKKARNLIEKSPNEALSIFHQVLQVLAKKVDHALEKSPHLAEKRCKHSSLTFSQQKQLLAATLEEIDNVLAPTPPNLA